jgi:hypothetical protein
MYSTCILTLLSFGKVYLSITPKREIEVDIMAVSVGGLGDGAVLTSEKTSICFF